MKDKNGKEIFIGGAVRVLNPKGTGMIVPFDAVVIEVDPATYGDKVLVQDEYMDTHEILGTDLEVTE